MKKYIVKLTKEEREVLMELVRKGKSQAYKIKHANILLKTDANDSNWTDEEIVKAFGCHSKTVHNVRKRFVEQGLDAALERQKQSLPSRKPKLDGEGEARLIAVGCSQPPQGHAKWTLRMLADKLVELEVVEDISHETVRQTLKKNVLKPHIRKNWVIPPKRNAEFVAHMEDILEIYHRPYDPRYPVVNMDEQPVQLIKETRAPIPAKPGQEAKHGYEYERNGTAAVFMFTEALRGWRKVNIRERRTAVDWAYEIKELLDEDYPDADKVILICDNLNTHKLASVYQAFEPNEAWRLLSRLEIHYTPKHGSWLNIAEIELSVFTGQCLDRRIPDIETLRQESKAWERKRNGIQKTVDWQFTTEDARIKLKSLYPQFQN